MSKSCYHCGLPTEIHTPFKAVLAEHEQLFCCNACLLVAQSIHDSGLQGFYNKSTQQSALTPPPNVADELAAYDLDEVQQDYVDTLDAERTMHLLVEGIHCAACVWLIENAMSKQAGVLSAEVNLTAKRLKLVWDNTQTTLSAILKTLASIGYVATPFDLNAAEGVLAKQHRSLLYRMAFAGFAMMNMLWIAISLYAGANQGDFKQWFYWISFLIATPTIMYSGFPLIRNAWRGLKHGYLTMDLPISIGMLSIYIYSSYVTIGQVSNGHIYFDTLVNFIFVVLVGRFLEAISKRKALSATQRLLALQPKLATLVEGELTRVIPTRNVRVGDLLLVKPGQRVPVDGMIEHGQSAVDESMLTGESIAIAKQQGDKVIAGSMNMEGAFKVRAEHILKDTALDKIAALMDEAQASKAPIQTLADKIVPIFVLVTLSLAALTFIYWFHLGFEHALLTMVAVLVVTCPCAFGLATPMSVAVAIGVGSKHGILVKQSQVIEQLSNITHVVFDKTGTLTEGELELAELICFSTIEQDSLLQLAASVEQHSEHSIASAICLAAKQRNLHLFENEGFVSTPGMGVIATVNRQQVLIGTQSWLKKQKIILTDQQEQQLLAHEQQGQSCVFVAVDGDVSAILCFQDQLRNDAVETINYLRDHNIGVSVLSGDKQLVVDNITAELGDINRHAELLPQGKVNIIKQLQQQGEIVAMVGDGMNDAPALIQADVGLAMASGTDVSVGSADVVLSSNELLRVVDARRLARKTLSSIHQNIGISITYNLIMVPLAMMGFVTPLVAAVTMPLSSLLVIANASRVGSVFKKK